MVHEKPTAHLDDAANSDVRNAAAHKPGSVKNHVDISWRVAKVLIQLLYPHYTCGLILLPYHCMLALSYPYDPDSSWDASRGLKCSWLQKSLKGLLLSYEFENVIKWTFKNGTMEFWWKSN